MSNDVIGQESTLEKKFTRLSRIKPSRAVHRAGTNAPHFVVANFGVEICVHSLNQCLMVDVNYELITL